MEPEFWHQRWQLGEIAFHEGQPNSELVQYLPRLNLASGSKIFVPLCGKTRDIGWLLQQGFAVVGAELSQLAVEELFADLQLTPEISQQGALTRYRADNIEIWQGDIFALDTDTLGPVDATYDRAALVALPSDMRRRYSQHLLALAGPGPQLLLTFDYDQDKLPGPPFCVTGAEVQQLYGDHYAIELLVQAPVPGRLKGKVDALGQTWLLRAKHENS